MRENRTYRLSGGRRRALRWAPPPTRHRRSGGIEPTRPRGGKGAPAGGTGGGKDGQHTEVGSRLHVTTTDSRTGQTSLRDGGGHRLASWTSGYATARSEAVCRGAGCGRTRTSGSVGGQGQHRPWSTRPPVGSATRHSAPAVRNPPPCSTGRIVRRAHLPSGPGGRLHDAPARVPEVAAHGRAPLRITITDQYPVVGEGAVAVRTSVVKRASKTDRPVSVREITLQGGSILHAD